MAFRTQMKVCFSDIDYAGIVYYPRFLHYFHVALEEFFGSELGFGYAEVLKKHRIGFPTVHLETNFFKPLHYDDHIGVDVKVLEIGRSSIKWGYEVYILGDKNELAVTGHNFTVCINVDSFKKIETPGWFRERLEASKQRDS